MGDCCCTSYLRDTTAPRIVFQCDGDIITYKHDGGNSKWMTEKQRFQGRCGYRKHPPWWPVPHRVFVRGLDACLASNHDPRCALMPRPLCQPTTWRFRGRKHSEGIRFYCAMRMPSAHYAVAVCLSVCLSVCSSVTRRYFVETAKHVIELSHRRVATPFYFFRTKPYSLFSTSISRSISEMIQDGAIVIIER